MYKKTLQPNIKFSQSVFKLLLKTIFIHKSFSEIP